MDNIFEQGTGKINIFIINKVKGQVDKNYTTTNLKQTQKIGKILAKEIISAQGGPASGGKSAVVLAMYGNLGGGKTTFLQGFAEGLGIKEKILSPTFVILKHFKMTNKNFTDFYHIDCYRLNDHKDILELDFKEIIKNPKNIVAVEWPEKIREVLPENIIEINFSFIDENTRELQIKKQTGTL